MEQWQINGQTTDRITKDGQSQLMDNSWTINNEEEMANRRQRDNKQTRTDNGRNRWMTDGWE